MAHLPIIWQGQAGALSDCAHHLYVHLGQTPASAAHLISVTGLSRRTLYRELANLLDAGLAVKDRGGYVRVECADPDALLPVLGAAPVLEQRAEQYRAQQTAWAGRHAPAPQKPPLRLVKETDHA